MKRIGGTSKTPPSRRSRFIAGNLKGGDHEPLCSFNDRIDVSSTQRRSRLCGRYGGEARIMAGKEKRDRRRSAISLQHDKIFRSVRCPRTSGNTSLRSVSPTIHNFRQVSWLSFILLPRLPVPAEQWLLRFRRDYSGGAAPALHRIPFAPKVPYSIVRLSYTISAALSSREVWIWLMSLRTET